jgi:predicted nucleotidyltransferase
MLNGGVEARLAARLLGGEFADVLAAYLFGSEAEGRSHSQSDVDVAVLLDRSCHPSVRERFERRLALMSKLASALPGRTLDLVVLDDLPPLFVRYIVTQGRRIHCSAPGADHAFVRDVQLRAADIEPFLRRMQSIKLEGLRSR